MSIKKIGIVILTLAMLATMIIIPVSAIEVEIMDYDYSIGDVYYTDSISLYGITTEFINNLWIASGLNYERDFAPYIGNNKYIRYNLYKSFGTQYLDPNNKNGRLIYQMNFTKNSSDDIYFEIMSIALNGKATSMTEYTIEFQNNQVVNSSASNVYGSKELYFYIPKYEIYNTSTEENINTFSIYNDGTKQALSIQDGIDTYLSGFFPLIYVEPQIMAMRANVTAVIPWLLGLMGTVVTSIFTPSGSLWGLAPLVVIGASVFIILIVHKVIKRFAWGV